mmetsp:Transcript_73167/g.197895  ORF Transcript_73167/g.197895 Transcript_73167/m.197895 type:complete len:333 (+) Transcript_73167:74-1072(+)
MGNGLSGIGCVGCEGRSSGRPVALVTGGAGIGIGTAGLPDDPGLEFGDDTDLSAKLSVLEEEKRAAVAIEDYDAAKAIKAEMDKLRYAAEIAAAPAAQDGPSADTEFGSSCVGPEAGADASTTSLTSTPGPGAGDDAEVSGEGRGEEPASPSAEPAVTGWLVYVPDDHGKFLLVYTNGARPNVATGDIIAKFGPTEKVPPFKITGKPTELKKHVDQNKLYYEGFCTFLAVAVKMRCSYLEVFNGNVPPNRPQVAVIFLEGDGLMESKHRVVKFGGSSLPDEPRRWEGNGEDIHFVGTISYMDNTFDNIKELVKDVFFKLCTTRGGCAIKAKS